eukprot:TRINITY_DN2117_c0_g1_i1.p1 TRINITY_DN2117_c0_g1~~TRINITY_DN2117_c0_g1_i1.p1  ORF type:complete len:333 (-),score=52.58 TRINITY_DN2117_c0_g1_i1:75-1073(-)
MAFLVIELPLHVPYEFLVGIAIFCVTPTTLTSGVILTKEAYGKIALALTFTVITNIIAVFTVPVSLPLVFNVSSVNTTGVKLETTDMLMQLSLTILLPLIVGKCLQEFSLKVRNFVKSNPKIFKFTSCCLLFLIPWTKISTSVDDLKAVSVGNLFLAMAIGLAVHIVFLTFNYCCASLLKIPLAEKKAMVIMCSEKTLPVAFTVVGILPTDGELSIGLISIPIITSHFFQLVTDAAVAQRWANLYEAEIEKETDDEVEEEIYETVCTQRRETFTELTVNTPTSTSILTDQQQGEKGIHPSTSSSGSTAYNEREGSMALNEVRFEKACWLNIF